MSKAQQPPSQRNLVYYCECFSSIKVYKTQKKGDALNKPILLLSIIDLITQDLITNNRITISDELIDTFKKYWEVLASSTFKGSDFALPFFHLKNDQGKFWRIEYSSEYDGGRPQTIPKLKEDVDYAHIALCKNHHWAFDRGWFAVDEQYKIIVSNDLEEASPHAKPMKDFDGEIILLPNKEQHFPELEALQWHRQNVFQA